MNSPLRFKENRNLELQCSSLEDSVYALRAALERERQLRRDIERTLENFVVENNILKNALKFQESLESF